LREGKKKDLYVFFSGGKGKRKGEDRFVVRGKKKGAKPVLVLLKGAVVNSEKKGTLLDRRKNKDFFPTEKSTSPPQKKGAIVFFQGRKKSDLS